jgi:hypothetical protein
MIPDCIHESNMTRVHGDDVQWSVVDPDGLSMLAKFFGVESVDRRVLAWTVEQ